MMFQHTPVLRAVLAAALLAGAAGANAATAFDLTTNFDNVVSGSAADSVLGSYASLMHFANPDIAPDVDATGAYTGTFHWVDATATYGDVLVKTSANAVSGANVLWNDGQPILLNFSLPVSISAFSIQQDTSGYGNPQFNGSELQFLDATGHVIAGTSVVYTQFGSPGLTLSASGLSGISGVLLAGGVSYDNLHIAGAVAAVPEPGTFGLAAIGLLGLVAVGRRRRA